MGSIKKEIAIGAIISLIATACGMLLYLEYISETNSISATFQKVKEGGVLNTVLAMAAIPNLFVFFIFIKKKQDYRARGVLLATVITALATFVLKMIGS